MNPINLWALHLQLSCNEVIQRLLSENIKNSDFLNKFKKEMTLKESNTGNITRKDHLIKP
jgi:hypothetical protein